ncbi:MAG TPA: zf-HC2 domain-containing protein [Thermoleophilaceae bacterium]|nr:zf-HC2 domain-containing protein [Thermoleophilaceae bacterium]
MEHAPLRPVPSRAAGPIDPAAAARELAAALPDLTEVQARALALVAVAAVPRADAAVALGIDERALSDNLATARKELRRSVTTLPGSGWCERAERLISDRLDGSLGDTDSRRLDVHLRNCPRCVEHERRLVQATDGWVATLAPRPPLMQPPPEPAEPLTEVPSQPPAEEPTTDEPAPPQPAPGEQPPVEVPPAEVPPVEVPPVEDAPAGERPGAPVGEPPVGKASAETPPTEVPPVEEPPIEEPVEEPPLEEPPVEEPPVEEPPAADAGLAAGLRPAPADVAAAAEVLVAVRTRRQVAAAITWNALVVLAVLLALVTIGFTVAGILGAEL